MRHLHCTGAQVGSRREESATPHASCTMHVGCQDDGEHPMPDQGRQGLGSAPRSLKCLGGYARSLGSCSDRHMHAARQARAKQLQMLRPGQVWHPLSSSLKHSLRAVVKHLCVGVDGGSPGAVLLAVCIQSSVPACQLGRQGETLRLHAEDEVAHGTLQRGSAVKLSAPPLLL